MRDRAAKGDTLLRCRYFTFAGSNPAAPRAPRWAGASAASGRPGRRRKIFGGTAVFFYGSWGPLWGAMPEGPGFGWWHRVGNAGVGLIRRRARGHCCSAGPPPGLLPLRRGGLRASRQLPMPVPRRGSRGFWLLGPFPPKTFGTEDRSFALKIFKRGIFSAVRSRRLRVASPSAKPHPGGAVLRGGAPPR